MENYKVIQKVIVVLLAVCVLSFTVVPSFAAADTSYYSYDYTNGTFYLTSYYGQMGDVNDSVITYDLPIHGYFNDASGDRYLNGFFNIHADFDYSFTGSVSPQDVIFTYDWDSDENINVIFASPTIDTVNNKISYTIYVFFTNYFIEGRRADLFDLHLHLGFYSTSTLYLNLVPSITSFTDSVTRSTEAQSGDGLAGQVAAAINGSSDIDSIITMLSYFTDYEGQNFISSVLSDVDNLDQVLSSVYSRLGSMLTQLQDINSELDTQTTAANLSNGRLLQIYNELITITAVLRTVHDDTSGILDMFSNTSNSNHLFRILDLVNSIYNRTDTLIYFLTGQLSSVTNRSQLILDFHNNLQSIIEDALDNAAPDPSAAESDQAGAASISSSIHTAESAIFDSGTTDLQAVDFDPVTSFGSNVLSVAKAGLFLGNEVTNVYTNLGTDFQFLIAITLTIGLTTVIIGVVNKCPKPQSNESVWGYKTYRKVNGKVSVIESVTAKRRLK